jgi:hypothetical protein
MITTMNASTQLLAPDGRAHVGRKLRIVLLNKHQGTRCNVLGKHKIMQKLKQQQSSMGREFEFGWLSDLGQHLEVPRAFFEEIHLGFGKGKRGRCNESRFHVINFEVLHQEMFRERLVTRKDKLNEKSGCKLRSGVRCEAAVLFRFFVRVSD